MSVVPSRQSHPVIGRLLVDTGSTLRASSRFDLPVVENLVPSSEHATITIDPAQSGSAWRVHRIQDLTIQVASSTDIRSIEDLQRVGFRGPIKVNITAGGLADIVRFEGNSAGLPKLSAGSAAMLEGLSGVVEVDLLRGAHLAGGAGGVQLASVESGGLTDSVLTGFTVPRGLPGRQLLTEMSSAFHLDPHTPDLPGWDKRWQWTLRGISRYREARTAPEANATRRQLKHQRQLYHDAEFLRELQRLVVDKGAPGSTRSRVGWCAYRLRELTSTRTERVALCVYRWVGYGERPLPALLTWLIVATLSAAIVLGGRPDLSWGGLSRLAVETLRQATGPLAGLLHGGESDVERDWEYLLRAAVAVPLVTGLLALRNYVKSRPSG
jgi:hypothetical protein